MPKPAAFAEALLPFDEADISAGAIASGTRLPSYIADHRKRLRERFMEGGIAIAMRNFYGDAGFTGCSSHTGRRSAISQLANKGVGIRIIQKFSGHRQLQSVQHYLDANEEMVKNAVELLV